MHYALGDVFGVSGLRAGNILTVKCNFVWLTSRYFFYQPFDRRSFVAQHKLADGKNWHSEKASCLVMVFKSSQQ